MQLSRNHRVALLTLILIATVAGCGSDSNESSSNDANGIESKAPQQALEETAAALRQVESFHIEGTQARGTEVVKADFAGSKKLRLDVRQRDATARMVLIDGSVYMNANAPFWRRAEAGDVAKELDGRWLKVPGAEGDLQKIAKEVDPAHLSRCLLKDHGTLAAGGTAKVRGQPAVVILDKGDRPGTSPGRLYIAATGEPLPLRTIATGPERPGGKKDPRCDSDTPTRAGDEVLFSRYDEPLDITAPPDALDLGKVGGGTPS
jgi:hypothetical protein